MNAERFHAIALAVREDLEVTEEVSLIQQLASSVRNQAQNPAETSYATQTNDLRAQLNKRLANAPSNTFSNAWRQTLEEIGIADVLGETLRQTIEEIFRRHEITLPTAADELEAIATRGGRS